ncbi:MAG: GIY-YIG nuclease family protein [Candidatus Omnitrophica bacterium]|nr:GIY-YIG nuclease family protein [Candidatus Omnitrophota bacterium]MBU1871671.1 GIY-YIG nuclease family protein [Candidatus Omnitrophota bacterium]
MYIIYILLSKIDTRRYYIGITQNLRKRLKEHNASQSGYSKRYAPWEVETYTVFRNKALAEAFEDYLKSGSGNAFLKKRLI